MNCKGSVSTGVIVLLVILLAAIGFFVVWLTDSGEHSVPPPPPEVVQTGAHPDDGGDEKEPVPPQPIVSHPEVAQPPAAVVHGKKGKPTELAGYVRNQNGEPIEGASVQVIHFDFDYNPLAAFQDRFIERTLFQTATDVEGHYVIPNQKPGGNQTLRASAPGYIAQIKDYVSVGLIADFTLRMGARVEGTVVDADTGEPVADAQVRGWYKTAEHVTDVNRLYRWKEVVKTDQEGRFAFVDGVPIENVLFNVWHDEYEDFQTRQEITAGRTNEVRFAITRGVTVEGVVLDKLHETPIEGALVRVRDLLIPRRTVKTDDKGHFRIAGLKAATQVFMVSAEEYTDASEARELSRKDEYDPERDNKLVFRLDPAGAAAGIVLDPEGRAVANARVFVARENPLMRQVRGQAEFRTGSDGRFLVKNLMTSMTYYIAAQRDGYMIGVSEPIRVGPEEIRDDVDVHLRLGSSISGIVSDENQVPIPGVRIEVEIPPFADVWFHPGLDLGQQDTRIIVTGDDGHYELNGLWTGAYNFTLTHDRHVPLTKQRVMVQDQGQGVTRDFSMKIGRFLAGTCLGADGRPAEDATVTVTRPWSDRAEAQVSVSDDGSWRVDGLVKGMYRVQAKKPGYSSEALDQVPADTDNINFRLRENGAVMGSVVDPNGLPVTAFTITLVATRDPAAAGSEKGEVFAFGPPARSFHDEGGRFHMTDIEPGEYTLTVQSPEHAELSVDRVFVPTGGPRDVGTLRLPRGATISGSIVSALGGPVRDALVQIFRTDAPEGSIRGAKAAAQAAKSGDMAGGNTATRPGPDGRYVIKGLVPGEYLLKVQSSRHVSPPEERISLTEGQDAVRDFTLQPASQILVSVSDDTGTPVPHCMVTVRDAESGRRPANGVVRTDARGEATLGGLGPGTYTLQFTTQPFLVKEVTVTVAPGAEVREQVQLERYH